MAFTKRRQQRNDDGRKIQHEYKYIHTVTSRQMDDHDENPNGDEDKAQNDDSSIVNNDKNDKTILPRQPPPTAIQSMFVSLVLDGRTRVRDR